MFRPAPSSSRPVGNNLAAWAVAPSATRTRPSRLVSPRCMFAVRAGAIDAVKVLLKSGATVHDTTSDGTGVLVMAIASTHFELADWLLEQGADPNAAAQGWTPLHQIAYTRRPSTGVNNPGLVPRDKLDSLTLAKKLIATGANPNQQATKNPDIVNVGRKRLTEVGATPFWVAAQTLDLPYMRLLVRAGRGSADAKQHWRHAAVGRLRSRHREAGRKPRTPEEVAAAVQFLLDLGADATTVDAEGNTALHGVAIWGSNGAVEMLVNAGAKLDVKNKRGLTPWRIAEGAVFEDAVSLSRNGRAASPADGRARSESRVAPRHNHGSIWRSP